MVPVMKADGEQAVGKDGKPLFKRTLADERLPKHSKAFGFFVKGKWMPLWAYMEKYEKVADPEGKIVPFEMNEAQITIYEEMAKMKESGRPVRINDGKARQVGGTTLFCCMFFPLTAFDPGKTTVIVADKKQHGESIMAKYRLLWDTAPDFLKERLRLVKNTATSMWFDSIRGTSRIEVEVQGEQTGRSMHANYLHESEVAFWQNIAGTMAALDSTVFGTDRDSIIVRETTSFGFNAWKDVYEKGLQGKGNYRSIFIPWYMNTHYECDWVEHDLIDYENKLLSMGLSKRQVMWWRMKWEDFGGSFQRMGMEFPTTPSEMFLSTGSAFFDMAKVSDMKDVLAYESPILRTDFQFRFSSTSDGKRYELLNLRAPRLDNGKTAIYVTPKKGHPYILAVDPAQGGDDYWAAHVIDNSNFEQCATFHAKGEDVYQDDAVYQLYALYRCYAEGMVDADGKIKDPMKNRVLFAFESNTHSNLGVYFHRFGVRDIYLRRDEYSLSDRSSGNDWGWRTTPANRDAMLSALREIVRDCPNAFHDLETACEFETFQYVTKGEITKPQATKGNHDDLVMALAGACYVRGDITSSIRVEEKRQDDIGFDPLGREKKKEKGKMRWMV